MDLFPVDESKKEAPVLSLVFMRMTDAVLSLSLYFLISTRPFYDFLYQFISAIHPLLLLLLCLVIYRLLWFAIFGRTPGMKLFKLVLLNGGEEPLSLKEKILASVFILYKGAAYYKE